MGRRVWGAEFRGVASMRWAARAAQQRLEEALPPDRRGQFADWMTEHRRRMTEHMGGPGMMGPGRGPMMGPGGSPIGPGGGRMMGPGGGRMMR